MLICAPTKAYSSPINSSKTWLKALVCNHYVVVFEKSSYERVKLNRITPWIKWYSDFLSHFLRVVQVRVVAPLKLSGRPLPRALRYRNRRPRRIFWSKRPQSEKWSQGQLKPRRPRRKSFGTSPIFQEIWQFQYWKTRNRAILLSETRNPFKGAMVYAFGLNDIRLVFLKMP